MKKKIYSLYLLLVTMTILGIGCQLSANKLANNSFFTTEETQQLQSVLDQYDQAICQKVGDTESSAPQCYRKFFETLQNQPNNRQVQSFIPDEIHKQIMQTLPSELKKKIWQKLFGSSSMNVGSDYYMLNKKALFFDYLQQDVAKDYPELKELIHQLQVTKSMNTIIINDYMKNYDALNVKDERIRLMVALYYLGLQQNAFE